MATTSSSVSKRRRFQVPITKYFSPDNAESPSCGSSHFNYAAPTHSPVPSLPHKVQSSLLTVGMRVRKSVPEGYKTTTATKSVFHISYTGSPSATSYAELAPFCGVLKTGNLAVQTSPGPTLDRHQTMHALDVEWDKGSIPSSSQESIDSSTTPKPNPHKRPFEPDLADSDDEGNEDDEYSNIFPRGFHQMWKSTIPLTSTARALSSPTSPPSLSRPTLLPRLAQKVRSYQNDQQQHQRYHKVHDSGQEIHDPLSGWMAQDVDFEEAQFLRRREEVDDEAVVVGRPGGMEVEMGGVE
ncbi:hypothetical protein RJZ56_002656 [Blastomyces dermatitidis]|uniref:Uncharacterized protein n=3 Tax=Blastomyces TaxID=229219 RepID=A0A179UYF5_BLAGS|nr:uncharacterized protein BDBG_08381 [Blastomyces gilchristii SLH14081]XP_045276711.1 uncharacterized protein BDCG_04993 [Blastomyces dermatitidis ER-3]EGE80911.1 hypothetical protein BDDG_03852 [Blastomyces dermatitidis ATCC 18188]EQL37871.1 hypothetical protein BDFG_00904 [Blastomyces dermatitidis ATCC 26199]EEQ89873.1 hypothetical protein BDCG_04993 [Blastomyces dermatitidis ER-3]OAT13116.1 hypothetical protein BDBG_08381 [Blastomyces gilchristii SLH14081]